MSEVSSANPPPVRPGAENPPPVSGLETGAPPLPQRDRSPLTGTLTFLPVAPRFPPTLAAASRRQWRRRRTADLARTGPHRTAEAEDPDRSLRELHGRCLLRRVADGAPARADEGARAGWRRQ